MRVAAAGVTRARDLVRRGLVRHVHDGERVLVGAEADFAPLVLRVGAAVDDALRLVRVAVLVHAAGEGGRGRGAHVHHVEPAAARGRRAGTGVHVGRAARVGPAAGDVEVAG